MLFNMTQTELLKKCLLLIWSSGICPKTKPNEWVKRIWYMHRKGWLFVHVLNDEIEVIVGAYRVKEVNETTHLNMPEIEEGEILFVPFMVSRSEDKLMVRRMLGKYMKENLVKEIVFYGVDNEKVTLKHTGEENGKEERNAGLTSYADISG